MRNRFAQLLLEAAEKDPRIHLITGDLGFSVLEPFAMRFPDRFFNAGVAEQNMTGVAAGLAAAGKKVFTFSIVNFAVTRCLEQIRNDVCYHGADVTVVAVGGGVPYGSQGYTHFGVEDVAFMRSLPGMRVYTPADRPELKACLAEVLAKGGPAYLRLAKGGEPDVHPGEVDASGLIELAPAQETTLVAAGTILAEAAEAAKSLKARGLALGLYSCPQMSSKAASELRALAGRTRRLLCVEEHLSRGGLGSFVAEELSSLPGAPQVLRLGLNHERLTAIGGQAFQRRANGIDAAGLQKLITGS